MPRIKFAERFSRSLVKAISFRLVIIFSDMIILFALTRKLDLVLGIITLFTIVNTIIYFFHERFWNTIHWGKTKHPTI